MHSFVCFFLLFWFLSWFFLASDVAPIRRPLRLRMLRLRRVCSCWPVVRIVVDARVCTCLHAVGLSCLAASLFVLLSCLLSLSAWCLSGFFLVSVLFVGSFLCLVFLLGLWNRDTSCICKLVSLANSFVWLSIWQLPG